MAQGAIWVVLSRAGLGDGWVRRSAGVVPSTGRPRRRRIPGARRVALVAGLAAGGALLLTVCGGFPPPPQPTFTGITPTPTPTPAPSIEPVAAPTRPAEMERTDEVGAAAAATYFMELNAYVLATGDVIEWNAVSGQDCGFCANTSSQVGDVYSKGHSYAGAKALLGEARVLSRDEQLGIYSVLLHYQLPAGVEVDRLGHVVEDLAAEEGDIVLEVIPSVRGWVLLGGVAQEGATA